MYDCFVDWIDVWVRDLNKIPHEKFLDLSELLFDIYSFPDFYNWFPKVPSTIFEN